jgi:hypothetical protein
MLRVATLSVAMLIVAMLIVVMLSAAMLSAAMLAIIIPGVLPPYCARYGHSNIFKKKLLLLKIQEKMCINSQDCSD